MVEGKASRLRPDRRQWADSDGFSGADWLKLLLAVQLSSGAALLLFFHPEQAWLSLVDLRESSGWWWLRPLHRWTSHAIVGGVAILFLRAFIERRTVGARRLRFSIYLLGLILLIAATGYPLPGDQLSAGAVPVLAVLSPLTTYVLHAFLLPLLLAFVLALYLRRQRPDQTLSADQGSSH